MDPISLATVTSAVTVLASECAKGIAGEAGKSIWSEVKKALGWKDDPQPAKLAPLVAEKLQTNQQLGDEILKLLKTLPAASGAGALVGHVQADSVVVADTFNVTGGFKM